MYKLISIIMLMLMTSLSYANDIYVTQSGASLDLDITQDGQNNTVGNSSTASSSTGATTILDIDQVGNSNVIKYQINGATYTGQINLQGNSNDVDLNCDSDGKLILFIETESELTSEFKKSIILKIKTKCSPRHTPNLIFRYLGVGTCGAARGGGEPNRYP